MIKVLKMKSCKFCRRIIVEDWENYKKLNPQQAYLQCPYCHHLEEIGVKQSKLNGKEKKEALNK